MANLPWVVLTDDITHSHGVVAQHPEPARRLARARWRDPQLAIGIALVVICAVVGARIISSADDTVPVLAAASTIGPGQELKPGLVETRDVQIEDVGLYLTGDVGTGYVVTREVRRGELVPRSAVGKAVDLANGQVIRYVPIALPTAELPDGLVPGSAVDVWTLSDGGANRLLARAQVSAVAGGSSGALGVEGSSATVTLAVSAGTASHKKLVSRLVAAARDNRVYLARLAAGGTG